MRIGFTLGVAKESNTRTKGRKVEIEKEGFQKEFGGDDDNDDEQVLWISIAKNYEMIQGAHITNSFILLLALSKAREPLSTTQISEIISKKSRGEIFKLSATLKDSLEYRLKRDGYVEGVDIKKKSIYSITPKGRKLLKGWIAFLSAYS
jgi:Domain of unknown function (DUF4364)